MYSMINISINQSINVGIDIIGLRFIYMSPLNYLFSGENDEEDFKKEHISVCFAALIFLMCIKLLKECTKNYLL